ncbi:ZIP family zinc transporter [Microbacterium sp. M3]|uniref:ZIP family zinc transporter n=1 Tax=Microbacterium arthrosphaerae TaxID=792652 RepID=A0ABU4GY80_9MICO|nr:MULTISPECIES: ZIP family zinc transporter [Microbacterium]MDW4571370.1 ZIP family zinc transporter [Microbacterium arthrosphaerae]MDW7605225.1 ZIP family zinc transporter [Microbacterium sp. M3]
MSGVWLAALSGLIGGGTLLVGAGVAWFVAIPQRVVAGIMAVGAGVLISTLAFELVEEAADVGGLVPTTAGFLGGAILYIVADQLVSRSGRKASAARASGPASSGRTPSHSIVARRAGGAAAGAGVVIAIGALIDGIPESLVMGLSVLQGGISIPIVAAIAISNIPEGLGSTAALKRGGASGRFVTLLWGGIALITVAAAVAGYLLFQSASPNLVALITTVAAGGLLAMVCNTMIPEAFAEQRALTGLWATLGFLGAFLLHELA